MRSSPAPLLKMSLAVASVLVCLSATVSHAEHSLGVSVTCVSGDSIRVGWYFYNNPYNPTVDPPWTGYDVLRRSVSNCGEFIRVNEVPFPWIPEVILHSHVYTEAAPATEELFQYRVILVDDNRAQVCSGNPIDEPCQDDAWASCPNYSAPITHGTLEDWGWALYIHPCPESCYYDFWFERGPVEELRPLAGTGTAIRFYGDGGCGWEGCSLTVDHYELAECGPVQVLPETWGSLKARYR